MPTPESSQSLEIVVVILPITLRRCWTQQQFQLHMRRNGNWPRYFIAQPQKKKPKFCSIQFNESFFRVSQVLLKFPDVIAKITKDLCLHHLCEFVYEISTTFTEFYDSCYCIEKNKQGEIVSINGGRVLLAEATAQVLGVCFHILGLNPLEKI